MLTAKRIINEEIRNQRKQGIAQGIAQGIVEGIKLTIEKMIKMNLEDDFIRQATGAEKSEIEKIRKSIEKNN